MGVLLNNRELKGSCGGLSNIPGIKDDCSCSNPCDKRKARMAKEEKDAAEQSSNLKDYSQINIDQLRSGIK